MESDLTCTVGITVAIVAHYTALSLAALLI